MRRNKNRGYQQLWVWQDAVRLYGLACGVARKFPSDLNRVRWQMIGSADSVHRNIAEGYCRRSIKEYLNFLNIALGSLGESVSGFLATQQAGQMTEADFETLDALAYKIENGMLRLVDKLEKKGAADWTDQLMLRDSNSAYEADGDTRGLGSQNESRTSVQY
jgi:four helix bundle protein